MIPRLTLALADGQQACIWAEVAFSTTDHQQIRLLAHVVSKSPKCLDNKTILAVIDLK